MQCLKPLSPRSELLLILCSLKKSICSLYNVLNMELFIFLKKGEGCKKGKKE